MARILLWLTAVLFFTAGCGRAPEGVLIQLPGAKNVNTYHLRGMDILEYQLAVKYPAKEHISNVAGKLKNLGWKPVPYIYLFPKNQSSHVLGWTFFNDPPKQPKWVIYEWTGDWLDANGNLVTYTFRYRDPAAKYQQSTFILRPVHDEMAITAIYTPAGLAEHKQRTLNPKQ
jgi:hypothetical protein